MKFNVLDSLHHLLNSGNHEDSSPSERTVRSNPPVSHANQPRVNDHVPVTSGGSIPRSDYSKNNPVLTLDNLHNHADISVSMRALGEKYKIAEITIVTDDGLVLATSARRNVDFDAVHYSHVVMLRTIPCEPDVRLFELTHKGSRLIGIIRTTKYISPALKERIRDDTKVILQWWL